MSFSCAVIEETANERTRNETSVVSRLLAIFLEGVKRRKKDCLVVCSVVFGTLYIVTSVAFVRFEFWRS